MPSLFKPILCPFSHLYEPIASGNVTEITAGKRKRHVSFSAFREFLHKNNFPVPQKLHMRVFNLDEWVRENGLGSDSQNRVIQKLFY